MRKLAGNVNLSFATNAYTILDALNVEALMFEDIQRIVSNPKSALFDLMNVGYIRKIKGDYYQITEEGEAAIEKVHKSQNKNFQIREAASKALNDLIQIAQSASSIEGFLSYLDGLGCTVKSRSSRNDIAISYSLGKDSFYSIYKTLYSGDNGKMWESWFDVWRYFESVIPGYSGKRSQSPSFMQIEKLNNILDNLIERKSSQRYCDSISEYEIQDVEIEVEEVFYDKISETPFYKEVGDTTDYTYHPDDLKFID